MTGKCIGLSGVPTERRWAYVVAIAPQKERVKMLINGAIERMLAAELDQEIFGWCLSCNQPMTEARIAEAHEDHGHAVDWSVHADEVAA